MKLLDFEGSVIESFELEDDPVCYAQNEDCLFIGYQCDGLEVYDWRNE